MSNESKETKVPEVLLGVATPQEIATLVPTDSMTAGITPIANVARPATPDPASTNDLQGITPIAERGITPIANVAPPTNAGPASTDDAPPPPRQPIETK